MKRIAMALVRFYQKYLSPRKKRPSCRYTPTCSCYALEALEKRGFFVGTALAVWRILRCNPFSPGGYDPVPDKGFGRKIKYHDLDRLAKEMRENGEMTFDYDDGDVQNAETAKDAGVAQRIKDGNAPENRDAPVTGNGAKTGNALESGQDAETTKDAGGPAEGGKQSSEKRDKYAPKKLPKYDRDGGKPRNSEKP